MKLWNTLAPLGPVDQQPSGVSRRSFFKRVALVGASAARTEGIAVNRGHSGSG